MLAALVLASIGALAGPAPAAKHRHYRDQPTTMTPRHPAAVLPAKATVVTDDGPSDGTGAGRAIDGDPASAWSTRRAGRGVMVTPAPGDYHRLAVITDTPGWVLEVYWSKAASPGGPESGDWSQAAFVNPASRRSRWRVPDAKHYLVWVAGTAGKRVRVNEIRVIKG